MWQGELGAYGASQLGGDRICQKRAELSTSTNSQQETTGVAPCLERPVPFSFSRVLQFLLLGST